MNGIYIGILLEQWVIGKMSILQTKFHKEFPKIFKDIELPLVNGGWVKFLIKETDDF